MSRLEYCAVAEPELLKLAASVAGGADKVEAFAKLKTLVGTTRYAVEWTKAQKPLPLATAPDLWAVRCWEEAHPRSDTIHRITAGHGCRRQIKKVNDCGCVVCDLARAMDLLLAVAESEKKAA